MFEDLSANIVPGSGRILRGQMMMDRDLGVELKRVESRPPTDRSPQVLSALVVDVDVRRPGAMAAYASRLRGVLHGGIALAMAEPFDRDELPESNAPAWLAEISREIPDSSVVPVEALSGRARYIATRSQEVWQLQDWLWSFEPGVRQWEWWDITAGGGTSAVIWLDSKGELSYSCDDIRWLAYVAGAIAVSGPVALPATVWEGQASLAG
jgi:hypothetical protein